MRLVCALCWITLAAAQESVLDGEYHFVELQIREGKTAEVASAAGTLQFAAGGVAKGQVRLGRGKTAMTLSAYQGKWAAKAPGFTLTNPLDAAAGLELRASQGVLVGASTAPGSHVVFIGVRAPAGAVSVVPRGKYKAAWFALPDASAARMITGLIDLGFNESGAVSQADLLVHAAGFDDITRKEALERSRLTLGAKGIGEFHAGTGSEWLEGKRELLASTDGSVLLGYWAGAGLRDVMVALRPEAVPTNSSWAGTYWTAGLTAEATYEFGASAPRVGSSLGTLKNDGAGTAAISERYFAGARERTLHTLNAYRMGTDGSSMLGRTFSTTANNFATGGTPPMFVAVQMAGEGELSLEHGIMIGVKTGEPAPVVEAPSFSGLTGPAKAGAILELSVKGSAPVEVWIGGEAAEVKRAGEKVLVTVPKVKLPGTLPLAVLVGDVLYDLATVYVAP